MGPSIAFHSTGRPMTRAHSPVFSSAMSIWVSATMRTRHPSESRICLTALPPGAWSSRTRMPTCRGVGVELVLTMHKYNARPTAGGVESGGCDVSGKGSLTVLEPVGAGRLLADYQGGA